MEFKDKVEYIKTHKKIDPNKFDNLSEITRIIDMLNAENDKYLDDLLKDIVEENAGYGIIPQEHVLKELEHRKKRHIANYKKDQQLIKP